MRIKRNDILLKGALEDFFGYFLRMIFPNADELFDFSKGFVFLEQELADITPGADVKHPKVIDKLVGVRLACGEPVWVRVHVEVEKTAKKDFGRRMFRYFSRLFDKYDVPVISIAVFLEKRTMNNKPVYNYRFHGTGVDFHFNSIYVEELDEQELSRSDNPFAKILLIAKLALEKKLEVQDIFVKKKALARQLLGLDLLPENIKKLMDFLKAYIHFDDKEINNKFDEELNVLTNKSETMGITEMILDMAEQKGRAAEAEEISRNMFKEGLDIQLIHKTTSLSINKLKKLRKEIQSGN